MRKMIFKKHFIRSLIVVLAVFIMVTGMTSYAAVGYSYDHNKKVIYSAQGLTFDHSLDAKKLGLTYDQLVSPSDLFLFKDADTYEIKNIYLTDSGSPRSDGSGGKGAIYEFSPDYELLHTFTYFTMNPGKLNLVSTSDADKYVFDNDTLRLVKSGGQYILGPEATDDEVQALRDEGPIDIYLNEPASTFRYVIPKLAGDPDYTYICDKGNDQVLVVDSETKEIILTINNPDKGQISKVYNVDHFKPNKVVADNAGRIYIIADQVIEGILQFDEKGLYKRYTGVNYITLKAWNIFWMTIATEEQYENKKQYDNTTFTGMALDSTGTFIYTTANPIEKDDGSYDNLNMVKKLNPAGKDVLRRNGYYPPQGDITYITSAVDGAPYSPGPSSFNCIAVNQYGMYTVCDNKRNKLFTYDNEGNMLYISSETGSLSSTLQTPVSIQYYGSDLLVLDKGTKEIKVFVPTEIGGYINDATIAESKGDVIGAAEKWEKVIQYNANYEYAYVGVGKGYLFAKDYKKAMEFFKKGSNKLQYSEAYKLHRNNLIKIYAPIVLYVVIGLAVVWFVTKKILIKKGILKDKKNQPQDLGE